MRRRRGRPTGFRLSEESKAKISRSKTGYHHSQKTKDKISSSLINYFKQQGYRKMKLTQEEHIKDLINALRQSLDFHIGPSYRRCALLAIGPFLDVLDSNGYNAVVDAVRVYRYDVGTIQPHIDITLQHMLTVAQQNLRRKRE